MGKLLEKHEKGAISKIYSYNLASGGCLRTSSSGEKDGHVYSQY